MNKFNEKTLMYLSKLEKGSRYILFNSDAIPTMMFESNDFTKMEYFILDKVSTFKLSLLTPENIKKKIGSGYIRFQNLYPNTKTILGFSTDEIRELERILYNEEIQY